MILICCRDMSCGFGEEDTNLRKGDGERIYMLSLNTEIGMGMVDCMAFRSQKGKKEWHLEGIVGSGELAFILSHCIALPSRYHGG